MDLLVGLPELFWIASKNIESTFNELSSQLLLRSPPTDWLAILFDFANKSTDLLVSFYLVNPRTFFAIVFCIAYVLYYIRNVVKVNHN